MTWPTRAEIAKLPTSTLVLMLAGSATPIIAGDGRDITPAVQQEFARLVAEEIDRRIPVPP